MTDRINVQLLRDDNVIAAVESNEAYIKSETLTEELEIIDNLNNGIEVVFDDVKTKLFIQKN